MNKKIKIVFVDIDWTLLNHETKPAEFDLESIKALNEIQKQGVKIFITTARAYQTTDHTGLLKMLSPDGLILCNGGLIIYKGEVLYKNTFDKEYFYPLCELTLSLGLNLEATEIYSRFLIREPTKETLEFFDTYKDEIPKVKDYHEHHILNALLFAPPEMDEKIISLLPKELSYYRFHHAGVDISLKPNYKGDGVKFILNYFKIRPEEAMAIGDDIADISMFEEVFYSVAMGNAKEEAKEKAFYITNTINESGVKTALEKFILKEEEYEK